MILSERLKRAVHKEIKGKFILSFLSIPSPTTETNSNNNNKSHSLFFSIRSKHYSIHSLSSPPRQFIRFAFGVTSCGKPYLHLRFDHGKGQAPQMPCHPPLLRPRFPWRCLLHLLHRRRDQPLWGMFQLCRIFHDRSFGSWFRLVDR